MDISLSPTDAGKDPQSNLEVGHVSGRIRGEQRLAGATLCARSTTHGQRFRDDAEPLPAEGERGGLHRHGSLHHGHVRNEGDVEVGGFPPYPISFRSIVPKASECANLLVPVCLSASHMAFGSIRMEPVFMVLGQSAATAASLAIDEGLPVQAVDYDKLKTRLAADGQVLSYAAPTQAAANYIKLDAIKGVVVDDTQAKLSGTWQLSVLQQGVHQGYRHDNDARSGDAIAVFTGTLPAPGEYEVQIAWSPNANRASKVPVEIKHERGTAKTTINQRRNPPIDGLFGSVGRYRFGNAGMVTISNADTDGHVIIDAVRWVLVE